MKSELSCSFNHLVINSLINNSKHRLKLIPHRQQPVEAWDIFLQLHNQDMVHLRKPLIILLCKVHTGSLLQPKLMAHLLQVPQLTGPHLAEHLHTAHLLQVPKLTVPHLELLAMEPLLKQLLLLDTVLRLPQAMVNPLLRAALILPRPALILLSLKDILLKWDSHPMGHLHLNTECS